ncbi:AAA family ATPase [Actinomadura sp. B10D3]|uniref:AAA family ATPase n=1 Tax=Actinomadura sp. B10D3 TaxID=3153557 RepID=UPI00325E18FF
MATAPNLVVAGHPGVARKLRETGRFPAVFDVSSASELRDLSKSGRVAPPAAFMFAPGFVEDLPEAGVTVLANGLTAAGYTVLVHEFFVQRGTEFAPKVQVTARELRLTDLLAMLGMAGSEQQQAPQEPETRIGDQPSSQPQSDWDQWSWGQWSGGQQRQRPEAQQPQAPPPQQAPRAPARQRSQPQAQGQPHPRAPAQQPPAQQPQSQRTPQPQPPRIPQSQPQKHSQQPPAQGQPHPHPHPHPQSRPQPQASSGSDLAPPPPPGAGPPQAPAPAPAPNGWNGGSNGSNGVHGAGYSNGRMPASGAPPAAPPAPARRGQVITVASAKGGVGKTSMSVQLALFASRLLRGAGREGSAVVVDANFQQADVARYLNLRSPTVLDLLQQPAGLSAATVRSQLASVPEAGLYALLGPPDAASADPALINSALYHRILAVLRQAFDYVFIDTPVAELYHMTFADLILPETDVILVPVEANRVTLEAVGSWLRAITMPRHTWGGGVAPEKLSLILNRARADVECTPEDVMDLMPGWRFVGMIPEDKEWMQAVNRQQLVSMNIGPDLEETFRSILHTVTGDQVFAAGAAPPAEPSRWKRLLSLATQ